MVRFFEKLTTREKRKKGFVTAAFRSHPMSRKRAARVQKAIGELLPDRPEYKVSNSEFEAVKARIGRLYGEASWDREETDRPVILRRRPGPSDEEQDDAGDERPKITRRRPKKT